MDPSSLLAWGIGNSDLNKLSADAEAVRTGEKEPSQIVCFICFHRFRHVSIAVTLETLFSDSPLFTT